MNASVLSFLSAFACSVAFAPIVALVACRIGMVDRPDGQRKLHSRIVPLTGGPVVLISLFVGLGTTLWIHPTLLQATAGDIRFLVSLAIAGILIVTLGILDDKFGLRGRQKLFGQFLVALIMLPSGIAIRPSAPIGKLSFVSVQRKGDSLVEYSQGSSASCCDRKARFAAIVMFDL